MPKLLLKQADCIADGPSAKLGVDHMQAAHSARLRGKYIVIGRRPRSRCLIVGGRRFYVMLDDVGCALEIDDAPVRRDPLVTALFGEGRREHFHFDEL